MRAVMIVNPHATATTERRRELLARALAGATDLTIHPTEYRGHAIELATAAMAGGAQLVIAYGGDGTVNEVVNGLLATGIRPDLPLIGVLPGGATNVFARALGIAADPTTATEQLLAGLAASHTTTVSVGRGDDRFFTFNAGLGLDAEVVRAVEDHRAEGRAISNSLHIRRAISEFVRADKRHPRLTVYADGERLDEIHLALVSNVDPWSYAGHHAVHTNPGLPTDHSLGLLALRSMHMATVLRLLRQMTMRRGPRSRAITRHDTLTTVVAHADGPTAFQVDGDYLGERQSVTFRSFPRTLQVVTPRNRTAGTPAQL